MIDPFNQPEDIHISPDEYRRVLAENWRLQNQADERLAAVGLEIWRAEKRAQTQLEQDPTNPKSRGFLIGLQTARQIVAMELGTNEVDDQ